MNYKSQRPSFKRADDEDKFQTKSAVHVRVHQMLMLERICSRFHHVATQLESRRNNRPGFQIDDESDVQDLLRALLTLEYDDIRPIEWTPSYATNPRTDFLLKLERIVVVARKAASDLSAKELADQLPVDMQKYKQHPDCGTLVYFVYDSDKRIANPREVENELSGDKDGLTVRVIIAPRGIEKSGL